jgi:hypothetical protein
MCSWRCSCSRNICREKPVFAGKVTSGVRNETSGQSWPSNTVATDPFTGQNRNSKCGSGIEPGFPTSRCWQGPRVRLSVKRAAWSSSTPRALTGNPGQHKRLGGWRPKTLYLPFQTLRYIGMAARGVLSSLPFSPINLDKGPSTAAMDVGLARLPATARLPVRKPGPVDR